MILLVQSVEHWDWNYRIWCFGQQHNYWG